MRIAPAVAAALAAALLLAPAPRAAAQSAAPVAASEPRFSEFWPELAVQVGLDERSRLVLIGSLARLRDYGTATERSFSVNYDWFAARQPNWFRSDSSDMDRRWSLRYRVGYTRVAVLDGGPDENRLLADATLRSEPLLLGLALANRNRFEWRDIDSQRSWRYRNRSRVERAFEPADLLGTSLAEPAGALGVEGIVPYAMLEFLWDSRVSDWRRRTQQYGVEFELRERRNLELYVAIQDELLASRARVVAFGAALTLRF